jgi:hypothetical protein
MVQAASTSSPDAGLILATGSACAAAWALIGVGLFAVASARIRTRLSAERSARAALERAFDDEEAALQASRLAPANEA